MKVCSRCEKRRACRSVCPEVERMLPRENTGKNTRREISMGPRGLDAAVDMHSYASWRQRYLASTRAEADLSALTPRELEAFTLLASGMTQRAAARELGINLYALQTRMNRARMRLAGQFAHLVESSFCQGAGMRGGKGRRG